MTTEMPTTCTEYKPLFEPLPFKITRLTKMEIERRFMEQNDTWVLLIENIPAAFGWVARVFAPIGELERFVMVPAGQVYLWNFRTTEAWRGKGFYPLLLQQIIQSELNSGATKIWIIAKPENKSSCRGIVKAGFTVIGEFAFNNENELVLLPVQRGELADDAAAFLQVPLVETGVKPCWCCYSNTMSHAKDESGCQCNTVEEELCHCA